MLWLYLLPYHPVWLVSYGYASPEGLDENRDKRENQRDSDRGGNDQ